MTTQPIIHGGDNIPRIQSIVGVLWPSFLTAVGATIVFFSLFSPVELAGLLGRPQFPAIGGYTLGFFFFWVTAGIACQISRYFCKPCHPPKSRAD
jgi:hypothetical protein